MNKQDNGYGKSVWQFQGHRESTIAWIAVGGGNLVVRASPILCIPLLPSLDRKMSGVLCGFLLLWPSMNRMWVVSGRCCMMCYHSDFSPVSLLSAQNHVLVQIGENDWKRKLQWPIGETPSEALVQITGLTWVLLGEIFVRWNSKWRQKCHTE